MAAGGGDKIVGVAGGDKIAGGTMAAGGGDKIVAAGDSGMGTLAEGFGSCTVDAFLRLLVLGVKGGGEARTLSSDGADLAPS